MIILCPSVKVSQDASLSIGGLTGSSGFHSVYPIQLLIGIIVVSEELGVLSLTYPDMDYIEAVTIIAYGDDGFETAFLSPSRICIEPDPLHLRWLRQRSILSEPVVLEYVTFDNRLSKHLPLVACKPELGSQVWQSCSGVLFLPDGIAMHIFERDAQYRFLVRFKCDLACNVYFWIICSHFA